MADAQAGHLDDPKTAAALAFALKLVEQRGQAADADIEALRAAGFDQLRQHSARCSGGLPEREIPPRRLERVPIK